MLGYCEGYYSSTILQARFAPTEQVDVRLTVSAVISVDFLDEKHRGCCIAKNQKRRRASVNVPAIGLRKAGAGHQA